MDTAVKIDVLLKAYDDDSYDALASQDETFRDRYKAMSKSLQDAVKNDTRKPVRWKDDAFKDPDGGGYAGAVERLARSLVGQVISDLDSVLNGLGEPGELRAALAEAPAWFTSAPAGCSRVFHPRTQVLCEYCGPKCHKVDGHVEDSCPGLPAMPLLWRTMASGRPVAYKVRIVIQLLLQKADRHAPQ